MNFETPKTKIHCWDGDAIATSLFRAAVIEGFAIAPLLISGMGHAGPNGGLLGYLSLLLNIPGLIVAALLTNQTADFSWLGFCAKAYLTQFTLLSYLMFVFIRRKNIKDSTITTI
jgi:hypothetical protein